MIHYHGTPISGTADEAARFLVGRHALVSLENPESLPVVADVCQSFCLDNGAFSAWRSGRPVDVPKYEAWAEFWRKHPAFDWCLIPDVIDGDADANDVLVDRWSLPATISVPVWHLHEPVERLAVLCDDFPRVALGSSGQWATPGSAGWWNRMAEAMEFICDEHGRPPARLHGLRMLDPEIFRYLPLASADSTNAGVNSGATSRFGIYPPARSSQRAAVIADRIERFSSAPVWQRHFLPNHNLDI